MKYLLLIYEDEAITQAQPPEEMKEWFAYTDQLRTAGKMLGGEALKPVATATTIRGADGKVITTDGPFAETKEQLGGFYMIEAKDLDDAIEWASKMPLIKRGGKVEIRPVMEFED